MQRGILTAVCALVIGIYVYAAYSVPPGANDDYYNFLVQGLRAGQLNLKKEVPPGLAQLADPYGPEAHIFYQEVGDMSYYKGKLYLCFGATPAVLLFWPCTSMSGHCLSQKDDTLVFCLVGFLASVGLLCAFWRRYFAEVSVWVMALGTLALGLAMGAPLLLTRCAVYEVPISCGYALTMLALAAIWMALHESRNRWTWLAAASLAYGLAVGARPSLLFGSVILLVPAFYAWRERREIGALLLAAIGPILLIGLSLLLYNALRFGSPFEFGQHYQINDQRQLTRQFFSLRYLWFNFRVYFLEPVRWGHWFPFVQGIRVPALPAGHGLAEQPFGVLTTIPLVWLALAVPLAWRGRSAEVRSALRETLLVVAVLFGICMLTLCLFAGACSRYEMEFLPELMLLAVVGILSVERAMGPNSSPKRIRGGESGLVGRTVWRRATCGGWGLLLGFSVAFNLLASVKLCAEKQNDFGEMLTRQNKAQEAIGHYERALQLMPDYAGAHNNLGVALVQSGRAQEAMWHWEEAVRLQPDYFQAHNNLGQALFWRGRSPEAIAHYKQALQINPDFAEAQHNWGLALEQAGRTQEAIGHYQLALRINPDFANAHYSLGMALLRQGRQTGAMSHWEQALRIKPDFAEAHYNLGAALEQSGRVQEAIQHYQQAIQFKPDYSTAHYNLAVDLITVGQAQEAISEYEKALRFEPNFADAHNNLGVALAQQGRLPQAVEHWEQALRLTPDDDALHNNLGNALMQLGRQPEAIENFEQALRINPNLADAHYNLGLALEKLGRTQEAIQHYEQALRIKADFVQAQNALARAQAAK